MTGGCEISAVIPHCGARAVLEACLDSLARHAPELAEIIVVDDAPGRDGAGWIARLHPAVRCLSTPRNLGYAGACNLGARAARGRLLLFLNDDTTHTPGWVGPLRARIESSPSIAAVQPKLLDRADPTRFDYAGAAGGALDRLGFPYARGRLFDQREVDAGQYDAPARIFWACGAACLVRRDAFEAAGGFDEAFFAHMEEIDLCWRLQLLGYEVWAEPASVVYHEGGATLRSGSFRKRYLNHRNSIRLLCAALPAPALAVRLPARLALECAALAHALATAEPRAAAAIAASIAWLATHPRQVVAKRRTTRALRRVSDAALLARLEPWSVAIAFFLRGRRRFAELRPDARGAGPAAAP